MSGAKVLALLHSGCMLAGVIKGVDSTNYVLPSLFSYSLTHIFLIHQRVHSLTHSLTTHSRTLPRQIRKVAGAA